MPDTFLNAPFRMLEIEDLITKTKRDPTTIILVRSAHIDRAEEQIAVGRCSLYPVFLSNYKST